MRMTWQSARTIGSEYFVYMYHDLLYACPGRINGNTAGVIGSVDVDFRC